MIADLDYDEVIVATGADWDRPRVPGADRPEVVTVDGLSGWLDAEKTRSEAGCRYVVSGGDRVGLALAGVARARGAEVLVLEASEVFAAANGLVGRWRYVQEARDAGVVLEGGAELVAIDDTGIHWRDREGQLRVSAANRLWISDGARPAPGLRDALVARGIRAHAVGDCLEVRYVEGAMESAAELLLSL